MHAFGCHHHFILNSLTLIYSSNHSTEHQPQTSIEKNEKQSKRTLASMRHAHAPAIVILTNNPYPVAGSSLSGTICLDVTPSSTTGIPATSSLCLSFHGEEVSTVASYMARADTTFKEESKCNIISSTISDFATFASEGRDDPIARLSAGQYEVPFVIDLPPWLPPTMLCKGQEGSSCAIRYTLEAFLMRNDSRSASSTRHKLTKPVASKEILILGKSEGDAAPQLPRPLPIKPDACEEEYNLFSMFCFPRGKLRVRGELLPQASARLGDQSLCLSLDVWNDSKNSEIDEIDVKLRENIRWQVGIKSSMPRKEKVKKIVTANVISHRQIVKAHTRTCKRLKESKAAKVQGKGKISPIDTCGSAEKESHTKCRHHHIKIDISIPYDARSSYPNGTLISVEHSLSIKIQLSGCSLLTTQPELFIPLTLQPPSNSNALITQMYEKRPRMVRRTVYGHEMGEKVVGENNPLFDRSYLYRTYYEGGGGEQWSHLATYWNPDYVGRTMELDLGSSGKVGGEEDISFF